MAHYSQLVMPDHINNVGTLFGGQMVSWMDIAAAKTVFRFLKGTRAWGAVTRAIDKVEFREPVYAGEWVNFVGEVVATGTTSITVKVDAHVEGRDESSMRLACSATITMVAVIKDKKGNFIKFAHGKQVD